MAVTVTEQAHAVVGVPEIRPLDEMVSPAGRPVALKVKVAPDWESVAAICRLLMAAPEVLDCVPGLVTATVLLMAQVKLADPW